MAQMRTDSFPTHRCLRIPRVLLPQLLTSTVPAQVTCLPMLSLFLCIVFCFCSDLYVSITTSPDRSISDGLLGGSRFQEQASCLMPRATVNEERNKCFFLQKLQGQLRFLQFSKVKEFVTQSCPTPQTVAHQGSSVHGILQARILEWVAISSSKGSS